MKNLFIIGCLLFLASCFSEKRIQYVSHNSNVIIDTTSPLRFDTMHVMMLCSHDINVKHQDYISGTWVITGYQVVIYSAQGVRLKFLTEQKDSLKEYVWLANQIQ